MSTQIRTRRHPELVSEEVSGPRRGWVSVATSADHKSIGRMYIATALFFAAIALAELLMMRIQLFVPENTLITPGNFDILLSAYGLTGLLLFALPLAIGLFSYIVPLQIGARGIALPRLHQLSYWLVLLGGVTVYGSWMYTPSSAGTTALPPLSNGWFSPDRGVDAWLVGFGLVLIGVICFAVALVATLRGSRAPGMFTERLPIFSRAGSVVAYTQLVVAPVMLAAIAMLLIDRQFDGVFFVPGDGGKPGFYEHLSAFFLAGTYASIVVAAFGAISEILPTMSGRKLVGRKVIGASLGAFATLVVLAWMTTMSTAPIPDGVLFAAMLFALLAIVPGGLIVFNWISTLRGAPLRAGAAGRFAIAAIVLTLYGLIGEMTQAVIPVGKLVAGTATAWADTHAAMIGAGVLGLFAGLYYWFPKITGRRMGETLGSISLGMIFLGALMLIIPMQMAGMEGMPSDVYKFYSDGALDALNVIASIGSFIFIIGFLLTMANAAVSYSRGVRTGPDPWGGSSLEWFAPSPPPTYNFDLVPDVRSAEPLDDIRKAIEERRTRPDLPPARIASADPEPVGVAADRGAADAAPPSAGESVAEVADSAASDDDPVA